MSAVSGVRPRKSQGSPVTGFQRSMSSRRFGCRAAITGTQDPFDTWFARSCAPRLPVQKPVSAGAQGLRTVRGPRRQTVQHYRFWRLVEEADSIYRKVRPPVHPVSVRRRVGCGTFIGRRIRIGRGAFCRSGRVRLAATTAQQNRTGN